MKPVNATLQLQTQKLDFNIDLSKPVFNSNVIFEDFEFKLDDKQYRDFFALISYFTNFPSVSKYRKFKPPEFSPKEYWKFASKF